MIAPALLLTATASATPWTGRVAPWVLLGLLAAQALLGPVLARGLRNRGSSLPEALRLHAVWLAAGAVLAGVFVIFGLDLEQHALLLWGSTAGVAVISGALAAHRLRRVPGLELALATVAVCEIAALALTTLTDNTSLTDPSVRNLLIAPAVIFLGAYFGASIGYLFLGDRAGGDLAIGYEASVGRRFLLAKSSTALSLVTTIAVVGVALGVWLASVALAVLAGFEFDLQKKIIGAGADVVLQRNDGRTFPLPDDLLAKIEKVSGVVAVTPFLQGEVAIASASNFTGGVLFGVDPERAPHVLTVLDHDVVEGSLAPLRDEVKAVTAEAPTGEGGFAAPAAIPNIVLGVEMRKALNVREGDKVTVLSPLAEELTPLGPIPASRPFRVSAFFSSEMYDYDAHFSFAALPALRAFFDLDPRAVSGVQIRTDDPEFADRVGAAVARALGAQPCAKGAEETDMSCGWQALDWKSRNQTLFAALKLERVVAFVVLVIIIFVASFSIVNTLTMSVLEKQKEIAILKTMGARDVGVMKIFLVQGMLVGIFGTGIGALAALATVWALETFGFWIPGAVYYIDSLPVHLEVSDVVLVVLAALILIWDFAVFPALRGSQLDPVEGLRDG